MDPDIFDSQPRQPKPPTGYKPQHNSPEIEPYTTPSRRKKPSKKMPIIIGLVLLLLAAAGGGYFFLKQRSTATTITPSPVAKPTTNTSTTPVMPQKTSDSTPAGQSNYISTQTNLNLSFNYPSDWTVEPKQTTPAATTPITVTSPSTTIASADGTSVTGRVIVSVRPGGGQIAELISASAAQDSTQIGYTHPTASQRQYPFLTFVHVAAGSKTAGAFEEVMITGGQQFKKGDVISSDNLGSIDPLLSASFVQCKTAACTADGAVTVGISGTTWQNASLFRQAEAVLTSFKLN